MALKLTFKGNTHLFKGQKEISEITQYIQQIYPELAQLSPKFTYLDEENDEITVSCNDDLAALFEFKKTPKLIISLPEVIPALKMTQAIPLQKTISQQELLKQQFEKEQQQQKEEEELKKKYQEELKQQIIKEKEERRQKMIKEKEERRKQMEQQRKEQIEKFFQDCKKDKHLSKRMTNFQAKLKEKMPEIEKFLQRDFTYEGTSSSSDSSENENEEEQKEQNFNHKGLGFFAPFMKMFGNGQQQPCGWFRQHQKRDNSQKQDGKTVHRGYACDGCNKFPIVGNRYECTDLPDFDYCETCYTSNNQHKEKSFDKIEEFVAPHFRFQKKRAQNIKNKEGKTVHRGYACDGCRKFPIVGDRYECTDLPDFDYCETCYTSDNQHKEKTFEKVEKYVSPHRFQKKRQEQKKKQEQRRKEKQQKEQKPQYELRVRKLAEEVSQILGNKEEVYYKICDLYKNESVNFIVDQIFNSPQQYKSMI